MTKAERDAWAAAYRLYEEYAPPLRQAATLDDDNDLACKLFTSAVEKVAQPYNESCNEGRLILLGAYGILICHDIEAGASPGRADDAPHPERGRQGRRDK